MENIHDRGLAFSSEQLLKTIMNASPVGIVVFDEDANVIFANPLAERIFALHAPGKKPVKCGDFIGCANRHSDPGGCGHTKSCPACPLFRAICETSCPDAETPGREGEAFLDRDSEPAGIWIRYKAVGVSIGDVQIRVMAVDDITESKENEAKLKSALTELSVIHEYAPVAMMILDRERRVCKVNGYAATFADRPASEMIGLRGGEALRCLHHLDDPQGCGFGTACAECRVRAAVLNTFETGQSQEDVEAWLPFPRGHSVEHRCLLISTAFLTIENMQRVLVCAQDITGIKRAEREKETLEGQLRQAQKMEAVGRLAGGVAHDFNNMLSVILGHTEMAMEHAAPSTPLQESLNQIRKAASRSADLTRQLLAFARKQTIAPAVLDLNRIVAGMLKMLQRLIGEDIDLAWMPKRKLWPVKMDPTQIDQILANLCINARDAIAGVGKITIESADTVFDAAYCAEHKGFLPGEYVLLAVSDNGCGMDPETMAHIYEPFYTTKAMGKGTGLGLSTVYGIVKQNGGFINVYSEPGHGTAFRIYLPRHIPRPVQPPAPIAQKPTKGGGETILLVEDEPAILKMTTMMLERSGYTVLPADTPGEAIRIAEMHPGKIHLLITDVVMPEMNGRELAKNLLSLYPGIKRLFMSGYTSNVIAHHGILDKGVNFIQKPFARNDLAVKVREALGD